MKELLPYVTDLINQHNETLVETLNNLAEAEGVLAVLCEPSVSTVQPLQVEVREGKYKQEKLVVSKIQLLDSKVHIWAYSETTGKPVKVQGKLSLHKEETENE